jgi:stress response protein YsnF
MSRTVTALYDTRAEAESARQRLSSAVDVDSVRIIDQESGRSGGSSGSGGALGGLFVSDEDRHAYDEGIRRGGFLLCAEVDGDENADRIIRLLEESASVDLDERQQSWRGEGWTPYAAAGTGSGGFQGHGQAQTAAASGPVVEEQRIPIVEEELRVGKREVARGGARVRSYVRETPVREQVTLREEHVEIERRPVDQPVSTAGATVSSGAEDLLRERSIEMRETAEEAVVQKVANVREEVIVRKTAEERTEQIEDTVRRTEVDVEKATGSRSAFGGFGGEASNRDPTR